VRVLIVKLSSLGDVVHALPVVADLRAAHPGIAIDWVVEPGFAAVVRRCRDVAEVIECPLRRWTRAGLWRPVVRREIAAFVRRLRRERYDAVVDLQGLTKSVLVACLARGRSFGLANRTEGSSHEWPARALAHTAIAVEPRSHALDRSRELVAKALGTRVDGRPDFGLAANDAARRDGAPADVARAAPRPRSVAFLHGSSRADKLWPETHWIELGRHLLADRRSIALPQSSAEEKERAERIAAALGSAAEVWPALDLGAFIDRLAATGGAIGVDSGPSHIAVALDLPHVQIYNFPTAWRTGPQDRHGARHQRSIEARPTPSVQAVLAAWRAVSAGAAADVDADADADADTDADADADAGDRT
jgi:heptosyltransferase-1